MKKIKFVTGEFAPAKNIYINSTFYMLKTYHDYFGESKDYEWLEPNQYIDKNVEEYVENLLEEDFDILGAGLYCWNNTFLTEVLRRVKDIRKDCVTVVGGPDVTARNDPNWFDKHPFVDYVVYGDGEKAFSNLLDYISDESKDISLIPNIIYFKDGKRIINRHEILRKEKTYWDISPWQHCKEYVEDDVLKVLLNFKMAVPIISWERTRGCPYSCSFCDYSAGLHNKVMRRTYDFRKDIDLIAETSPVTELSDIDANIGIFDEDIDIIKYILDKQEERGRDFMNISIISWSKLKKDNNFKMIDYLIEKNYRLANNNVFKISQQDMNDHVLQNIDRPSVAWPDLKKMLLEKIEKSKPNQIFSTVELLVGLPGQTRETWNYNIQECIDFAPIKVNAYPWQLVPYAPAMNGNYLEKFKIKSVDAYFPSWNVFTALWDKETIFRKDLDDEIIHDRKHRDELMEEIKNNYGMSKEKWSAFRMVTESYSFDFKDVVYFNLKANYFNKYNKEKDLKKILEDKEKEIDNLTEYYYNIFMEDLNKYGFILFTLLNK